MPDLSSLTDEQLNVYKDLLSKKQGIAPVTPQKAPETTLGKVGNFLKGQIYDPTIGSIGQGARDVMTPGSRMKGAHEMITGAEKAATPLAVGAAIANPEVTIPAMAVGAMGEAAGKYIPKAFGASEDVSNLTGDIAGLVSGGLGAKAGPRISSAARVAAPDVAMGIGKAGAGMATGAAMHGLGVPGSDFSTALLTRPGLRQIGQGLVAGARELLGKGVKASDLKVEAPSKVTPPKGPSVGELKAAVKNGTITPEQFDARIDQMSGMNDEAKTLAKSDIRTTIAPKSKITPDTTPKVLSLGQLERLTKMGRLTMEEFNSRLAKLGYSEEDRGHLSELLKATIEEEKAAKEEGGEGVKPSPKEEVKTEVKSPLTDEQRQEKIDAFKIGKVETPGSFQESLIKDLTGEPQEKPPITELQIEESQSIARAAKETTLARYLANNKEVDLDNIPKTAEYLRAIGKEAGLKREPSLRTLENAIIRARGLRALNKD